MRYLSVCSGIEAATVAWHPLGWEAAAFAEVEAFPSAVLKHHYPGVPNLGDMTKFKEWNLGAIDLLVGGTPCQSFSIAGLRKGLADPRGNLMLTYLAIADRYRPRWLVWENVPGVLSSNGGRDFGTLLGGLGELGYGFAYRVLDAQYLGVAQRRRRVFVVGCLGDWRSAAAVLFERHSVSGYPAPCRQAGQGVAGTISSRTTDGGGLQPVVMAHGQGGAEIQSGMSPTLTCNHEAPILARPIAFPANLSGTQCATTENLAPSMGAKNPTAVCVTGDISHTLKAEGFDASEDGTGRGQPIVAAFNNTGQGWWNGAASAATVRSGDGKGGGAARESTIAVQGMQVRRLTPVECERLQGFPDDYTRIPWRGGKAVADYPRGPLRVECPDGPRYKALGNSMAVPVMRWIGERIQMVEEVMRLEDAA